MPEHVSKKHAVLTRTFDRKIYGFLSCGLGCPRNSQALRFSPYRISDDVHNLRHYSVPIPPHKTTRLRFSEARRTTRPPHQQKKEQQKKLSNHNSRSSGSLSLVSVFACQRAKSFSRSAQRHFSPGWCSFPRLSAEDFRVRLGSQEFGV